MVHQLEPAVDHAGFGLKRPRRAAPGDQPAMKGARRRQPLMRGAGLQDKGMVQRDQGAEHGLRRLLSAQIGRQPRGLLIGMQRQQRAQPLQRQTHGAAMLAMGAVPLRVAMRAFSRGDQIAGHIGQPRHHRAHRQIERGMGVDLPEPVNQRIGPARAQKEGARLDQRGMEGERKAHRHHRDHGQQRGQQIGIGDARGQQDREKHQQRPGHQRGRHAP
jgi:hypothetical protein